MATEQQTDLGDVEHRDVLVPYVRWCPIRGGLADWETDQGDAGCHWCGPDGADEPHDQVFRRVVV